MKKIWISALVLAATMTVAKVDAGVFGQARAARYSNNYVGYYDPAWGNAPHALITPPQVRRHIEYQQGVGGAMNLPIYRDYPGEVIGGGPYSPMRVQPYSTNHMGVYYLRSPH